MEEVLQYLKENPVFFLATTEGEQPRVRPFGAVAEFEGNLYICTNNKKKVFEQMKANEKVEICGMDKKGGCIRIEAKAVQDDRNEARAAMLEANPALENMYKVDDMVFEVLFLKEAIATFNSFGSEPKVVTFG